MKCTMGESKAMNNNLDCSKQGANNWDDVDKSIKCFDANPGFMFGLKTFFKSF